MAPDKKDKKRKAAAATAADSPAKKTKKVEAKPAESPKDTPKSILKKAKKDEPAAKAEPASKVKANGQPARQAKPRKRAADFLSDNEDSEPEVEAAESKAEKEKPSTKKSKKEDGTAAPATKAKKPDTKANTKAKKAAPVAEESDKEDESAASDASQSEGEEDDRTVALIRGFESSGDEDESGDEGFNPDQPVPKIPDSKKAKRKILKKQRENAGSAEEPGTVYIGRIPHGFYEHQMREYFSQFGEITRLRLSRNRITGRSKHYAFIEFASTSVAKIVAGTMDNYLMYGHILKCKYVPAEQLHPEIWKGANRRFKRTPWNRIEKKRLDKGKTREQWTERIGREQKKRLAKAEKLKSVLGYDFELPQLKSVDDVPVQEAKAIEASEPAAEEPVKAIEAPSTEETKAEKPAEDTPKKTKKTKKAAQSPAAQETPKTEEKPTPKKTAEVAASPAGQKAKKIQKKTKAKAKA
ncbi:hypothetical protein BO71DRAFT_346706 [Aspergillus ellipticus CBS 707.79]|uniref:RRM domain-containing protein n=1 Tax=Aspergillus ellipticus CBS 707.79 TaxID=1448320 RepID=A0A319EZQ1_9EURO|nr:hypothetical protein BO71DRAFT_346706 [Aspergillus ellipticus CBS 707.79]